MRLPILALLLLSTVLSAAEPRMMNDLVYTRVGARDLRLDLCLPEAPAKGAAMPLMVWIHGGGWRGGSRKELGDAMRGFAGQGVAGASIEYRFATEAKFPAQLDDVRAALAFLVRSAGRYGLDLGRVIIVGGSAGGHLALLAGFAPPQVQGLGVCGIINIAGPTQLALFATDPRGDLALKAASGLDARGLVTDLLGNPDRSAAIYAEASPLTWVRLAVPPVLTLHGTDDLIVPIAQAEALHAALRLVKADETFIRGIGGGHDFGQWPQAEKERGLRAMQDFVVRRLAKP